MIIMKVKINVSYAIKDFVMMKIIKIIKSYTDKYRGAALSICNLWYRTIKKIPVVFHNGSKYHWHLIIK